MSTFRKILRTITLSVLFAGSSMIVFAAITLVKAAHAKGVPIPEAAANNVPLFINYSKISLACAVGLLIAEVMDVAKTGVASKNQKLRWAASLVAIISAVILSVGIIPPMEALIPVLKTAPDVKAQWDMLHHSSEGVFSLIILASLVSLLLPQCEKKTA